jgi:V/A-type H+-transporting ATPase subunit G/H
MDDTLRRLLDAEVRAERIAHEAELEQESIIRDALAEAHALEERFRAGIPDLHRSHIEKAEQRAEQTVAELQRRYEERYRQLRELAEQHQDEALEAAFKILISAELET